MKSIIVRKYMVPFYLALVCIAVNAQNISSGAHWLGGVAKSEITPKDTMWMAGYASRTGPATAVLHSLWVKALALQDTAGKRAVLVTMDLVGIPKDLSNQIKDRLHILLNLDRSQIILNTSHTHSGPVLEKALFDIYPLEGDHPKLIQDYSKELVDQIVKLVENAFSQLEPVDISAANGVSRIQVNRRNNLEKKLTIQSELQGPNDFAVPVLKISRTDGTLKALAFGYACHPTVLDTSLWSGDYPGYAQIELEKNYPGITALFFQGAGADQNPLPRRTIPLAKQYGRTLAAAVDRVLEEEMMQLPPRLSTLYREINLDLNEPPSEAELVEYIDSTAKGYQIKWAERVLQKVRNGDPLPRTYAFPLQVWDLGGLPLFTLGGEVVVNYSLRLKEIFGQHIFVMGYSNDVMAYIPSATILHEGGYEGCTSQMVYGLTGTWKYDTEQKIIQNLVAMAMGLNIEIPGNKLIQIKEK